MKKKLALKAAYILTILTTLTLATLGSRAVAVFSQNSGFSREHCFVIDAGHGGPDGGASSCTGVRESDINLAISLRLRDLLHFLGYQTRMIRTEDISVYTEGTTIAGMKMSDLKERARICQDTTGAILLSIHQNTFPDSRYSGAQVFYAPTQGSKELAQSLQETFLRTLNPDSRRAIKESTGVYLMEHIHCPGVLIECGFLSHPEEEAKLRSPNYQRDLCCVIASCAAMNLADSGT